jgi:S-formylglutathione hydrolase FrmB
VTRRVAATVLAAALFALSAGPVGAGGHDDELPPQQDNGAQGRDTSHPPPVQACADKLRPTSRSLVIRVLPRGPIAPNRSLAFQSGVCIYLPPGYVSSGLRYPVLYLLHGGGGDQADWVTHGHVRSDMDKLVRSDPRKALIVVMPDGRDAQWYDSYDRSIQNERYFFDYVIPYVDRHFRTIADRAGRAITGLSNGGYGALHFAAKRPDLFVAAGSMSGNVGGRSFGGLGTPVAPGGPAFQEVGTYYYGNVPAELVVNLDYLDLVINWGSRCSSDLSYDLCARWGFEQLFRLDNQHLRDRLIAVGHRGRFVYSEDEGAHGWRWWPKWLVEKDLPVFFPRLADPEPASAPAIVSGPRLPFRYRSIATRFSVYGYDVRVRRTAREFLDLRAVNARGFTVQGSGKATILTPALYRPGRTYVVAGAGGRSRTLTADAAGRLRVVVDLGPSHPAEQYSAQGRAREASGDYWTVRKVTIR